MQKVRSNILMVETKSLFNNLKLLSFIGIVVIIISCERSSLSSILCGGNIRYWEYVDDEDLRFPIYFLFDTNGRWTPLYQDEQGNIGKYNFPIQKQRPEDVLSSLIRDHLRYRRTTEVRFLSRQFHR